MYFPRIFIPITAAAVYLVDLAYSLGIYALVLLYYRVVPSWTVVLLPLLILLTLIATLSIGYMLSALTVFYRDFRHMVPFLTQIFLYFSPVIYPAERDQEALVSLDPVTQPDVRPHHGVSLVHPGARLGLPLPGDLHGGRGGVLLLWRLLLPQDRAPLRRLHLIPDETPWLDTAHGTATPPESGLDINHEPTRHHH